MRIIRIKKRRGSYRTIYIPNAFESRALKFLKKELDWIYIKRGVPDCVHGFVAGRSAVSNAKAHTNYKYTISYDLKDFFDSINISHFQHKRIPRDILGLCLVDGAPRQGLCTSPTLSNIAFMRVDYILQGIFGRNRSYTRYADDLTFSGNDLDSLKRDVDIAMGIVKKEGFRINEYKTKIQSAKSGRRIITGVSVDSDVKLTRKTKRKLRAAKHQGNLESVRGLESWEYSIDVCFECTDMTAELTGDKRWIKTSIGNIATSYAKTPKSSFKKCKDLYFEHCNNVLFKTN